MTARVPRLIVCTVIAVAITLPVFRIAATVDAIAGDHSSRHWPLQQQRVIPVAEVRHVQQFAARISALKELFRRSRASQPLLKCAEQNAGGSMALSGFTFPLRC
jgi:hypothetical protein